MQGAEAVAQPAAEQSDSEVFRVLVADHSQKIFGLAFRLTGNEPDAEDVVQETFLRAFGSFRSWESRAQITSWLYRIATNYAIDLLRRRKRWRMRALDDPEQTATLTSADPDPHRAAVSGEVERRVQQELSELSPRERAAFALRHYEGLSIRQIGVVLGTRESATKNHIFRAVRKMRRALAPMVEDSQ
jgi:RNA polymerase sigma-70 factor (ECF subfamily)